MTVKLPVKFDIIKDEDYFSSMKEITAKLKAISVCGYFDSFDDTKMFYEYFKTDHPKANIVIIHGYTEFTKKFYELTWYFHNMGYNVFLYDLRCHGFSHRYSDNYEITHVDSYDDYVSDLEIYLNKIVKPNGDDLPIYMYTHSMGGTIAQLYLSKGNTDIKKVILSAPMVYPCTPPLPKFLIKLLLSRDAKKYGWDAKFRYSGEFNPEATMSGSNDSSYNRFKYNLDLRIAEKKYQNSSGTNRWIYEAVSVADKILNKYAIKNVKSDILILIAGKDTAVSPKYQKKLVKMLNCKYRIFENSKHSLYSAQDNDMKEYINTLADFFES